MVEFGGEGAKKKHEKQVRQQKQSQRDGADAQQSKGKGAKRQDKSLLSSLVDSTLSPALPSLSFEPIHCCAKL